MVIGFEKNGERDEAFINRNPLGGRRLIKLVNGTSKRFGSDSGLEQGNHSDNLVIQADNRWEK